MLKQAQFKLVAFQGRIECYFPDNSIILWQKGIVNYYSTKGNKIRIAAQTIKLSGDVNLKIEELCKVLTNFEDEYYASAPVQPEEIPPKRPGTYFKKYKIQEFYWQTTEIVQTQDGFCVKSDDKAAKVILKKDLFNIVVQYPQRTGYRKVSQEGQYLKTKNRRKELIQKYGGKYLDYPDEMIQVQIEYQYIQITKEFTMFCLPQRWCPPLKIIWGYLLSNRIIPHPFCYIDFQQPQNRYLVAKDVTKMPPVRALLASDSQQYTASPQAIPLYGKPNHKYKWKWLYVKREDTQILGSFIEGGDCIIRQNFGFWFFEGTNALYKKINKDEFDYKVALSVFPLTVRFENQPARSIKSHILTVKSYKDHRLYLESKQQQEPINTSKFNNQEPIAEEEVPQIGVFKAYEKGVVIARFQDKTLMTIRNNEIKIIAPNGRSLLATLGGAAPKQFRQHLRYLTDWYEKIYNHKSWQNRLDMNQALLQHIKATEMFLNVTQHYKKS